jgi:hypothetical protein
MIEEGSNPMESKPVRYLIFGQISLVLLLVWCYLIDPSLVGPNRGLSNYGLLPQTRFIYPLAFILCGWFVAVAARAMPQTPNAAKWLTQMLWVLVFWIIAIWLTTYIIFTAYGWLHKLSVVIAFSFEFVLAGEIALLFYRNWATAILLLLETLGLTIAIISNFHVTNLLFVGQLITQIAFAPLITLTAWHLSKSVPKTVAEIRVERTKLV